MARPPFSIEFYEDDAGDSGVYRWLTEELPALEAAALGLALNHILQQEGANVVKTRYGRALGKGLYEFRLDDTVEELLKKFKLPPKGLLAQSDSARMLLRVFFAVVGDKVLLLLGVYDKGKSDSKRRQQLEISNARKQLKDWTRRASDKRKQADKGG